MLRGMRDIWDKTDSFQAMEREQSELLKINVLRHALLGFLAHTDKPVCFDKNRMWLMYRELMKRHPMRRYL